MEGFVIGMDLTDLYTHICCADPEAVWIFPTTVCRLKKRDEWFVDEEAYAHALLGDGVVEDKLLTLLKRQANATIGDVTYSALALLKRFFAKVKACNGRTQFFGLCAKACRLSTVYLTVSRTLGARGI